ncbi:WxL domain-containing protein [Lacticaseibacillus baoqingensis]|uniref:WxL domain-containing protein n=1 Tax=Lacticaseibacillus baoqingensis TaxID=2486013 RepID=A0ABW4E3Q7_9LACO|nr:WxL domain-containing protein [Lacticaseibacillus baoqingensis]
MKLTKMTAVLLASATVLGGLLTVAPSATHAATQNNNAAANNGVALPQTDTTKAGISFGQPNPNGNSGYLRLQKVPQILDFGNHERFDSSFPAFTADGINVDNASNNRYASYKSTDTNMTAILNTSDAALNKVNGKAWATVVDKQDTRTNADTTNTAVPGQWTLSVKADGPLSKVDNQGNAMGSTTDALLNFKNTAYGETGDVYTLTGEAQDQGYAPTAALTPVSTIADNISLNVAANATSADVATAADGEGAGANVFGWSKKDITLTLPSTFTAENAIYETSLTWTLKSGID